MRWIKLAISSAFERTLIHRIVSYHIVSVYMVSEQDWVEPNNDWPKSKGDLLYVSVLSGVEYACVTSISSA